MPGLGFRCGVGLVLLTKHQSEGCEDSWSLSVVLRRWLVMGVAERSQAGSLVSILAIRTLGTGCHYLGGR